MSRLILVSVLAALLNGCAVTALPLAVIQGAATATIGATKAIVAVGTSAAGAATAGAGAAVAAAGSEGAAGHVANQARPDSQPAASELLPPEAPAHAGSEPMLALAERPTGSNGPTAADLFPANEPPTTAPATLASPRHPGPQAKEDDEEHERGPRNGYSQSAGGSGDTSQCMRGPGFSACQEADVSRMAVAGAVAGAIIISSIFRDGEEVASACELNCGETTVTVSCPLPQTPYCACGDPPVAECRNEPAAIDTAAADPATTDTESMPPASAVEPAEPAEAAEPAKSSRINQQIGK